MKNQNEIKRVITQMKIENKHSSRFLSEQIGIKKRTVEAFFKSEKGSIDIADKLLKFYNLKIVDIKNT